MDFIKKSVCVAKNESHVPKHQIFVLFTDGTSLPEVVVEYPIGHKRRRTDGIPLLVQKFRINLARRFTPERQDKILSVSLDQKRLETMSVSDYVDLYGV